MIHACTLHRVNADDIDALKKPLPTHSLSKSEIYIVTLKAEREERKVNIKFKPDGSPEVVAMSSKGSFEMYFDLIYLHR